MLLLRCGVKYRLDGTHFFSVFCTLGYWGGLVACRPESEPELHSTLLGFTSMPLKSQNSLSENNGNGYGKLKIAPTILAGYWQPLPVVRV